jgi:hypothetical protein
LRVTDDFLYRPVAALDQYVRAAFEDALDRRVLVEPGDQRHAFERGQYGQPVGQRIYRAVVPLAQPPDRRIRVERHDHRRAQRAGLCQQGHVPAVQDVEATVGEYQRARQLRQARGQAFGGDDL